MNDSDRAWQRLGDQDPYFGVLSHEEFLASSLNEESLQKFFHSGEAHINHVCEYLQSRMGASLGTERVLDYGCGVGRLVIPLSMRFREVVGVDVSLGMLEQARRNCEKYAVQNARLMHTDELNSLAPGFDLVHSFIVFQHIPVRRGEQILRQLIALLANGGLGAIHLTYSDTRSQLHRAVSALRKNSSIAHGLMNLMRGAPFSRPFMQMNSYSINRILDLLLDSGCSNVHIEFSGHSGIRGIMLYFQKTTGTLL